MADLTTAFFSIVKSDRNADGTLMVYGKATDDSIDIDQQICDDTWFHPGEGIFIGKCSAAIPYLCTQGYKVLHYEGYRQNSGVILGRFKE
jgi:hypothetical protein